MSLNISDFNFFLFFFFLKMSTPRHPTTLTPPLPHLPTKSYPPLKVEVLSRPPFWKFGRGFPPPAESEGGGWVHTMQPAASLKTRLWHMYVFKKYLFSRPSATGCFCYMTVAKFFYNVYCSFKMENKKILKIVAFQICLCIFFNIFNES